MQAITTIGLDIAKSVFQVHGIDAEGKVIIRRQLKRRYVLRHVASLVARAQGARRLTPPAYVKPYVKRQKNDAADAEAICEAATRRCVMSSASARSKSEPLTSSAPWACSWRTNSSNLSKANA